jgi:hypothetical protein
MTGVPNSLANLLFIFLEELTAILTAIWSLQELKKGCQHAKEQRRSSI